jgi:hypothetical protein
MTTLATTAFGDLLPNEPGGAEAADKHCNRGRHLITQAPAHVKEMDLRYASP